MYGGGNQQRGSQYSSATPSSPPLHHPVPQHPIPPFRSPPPATASSSANRYAPPATQAAGGQWQEQQTGGQSFGGAGIPGLGGYQNIFSDPSTQLGIEVGRNALNYGQEYIGKSVSLLREPFFFKKLYMQMLMQAGPARVCQRP